MTDRTNAARGILFMLAGVFLFTVMDALSKAMSQRIDTVMVIWARYLGQTVIVLLILLPRMPTVLHTKYPGLQALRSFFLLAATVCFFFAISLIGLAEATAIIDLNPVLITLGAAILLKESFGPRRAAGIAVSLIGALIIIRPGTEVFSVYAILPLISAVCFTGYALATRFVGRDEDAWTSLLYTAAAGSVVMSFVVPWFWTPPDGIAILMMLAIGAIGAASQLLIIKALTSAEASTVAPFAYIGLIFATIWGMLFFGEYPDALTWLGGAIIISAGVYVWYRETRSES